MGNAAPGEGDREQPKEGLGNGLATRKSTGNRGYRGDDRNSDPLAQLRVRTRVRNLGTNQRFASTKQFELVPPFLVYYVGQTAK